MPTIAKVLMAAAISLTLLIVAGVGIGIYWWTTHRQQLAASVRKVYAEGQDFGANTDNAGCLREAVARHKQRNNFTDAIANNLFLRGCLEMSRPTAGFCDGVPKQSELTKTIQWQLRQCAQANLTDSYCGQMFGQVQQFCEKFSAAGESNNNQP